MPAFCPDDKGLIAAFKDVGIEATAKIWDEWELKFNVNVLMRTPWDYAQNREKFESLLQKIESSQSHCINSLDVIRWNMNKKYLVELSKQGVDVIPTKVFLNFNAKEQKNLLNEGPVVCKPLVGAGGIDTFLVEKNEDLRNTDVLFGRDILVQPFISDILDNGELSFIYFDHQFSHAILKKAKSGEFRVQDDYGGTVSPYEPTKDEVCQVNSIIKATGRQFSYVRVDVVKLKAKLLLMGFEAIEPELFFRFSKDSMYKYCKAVKQSMCV